MVTPRPGSIPSLRTTSLRVIHSMSNGDTHGLPRRPTNSTATPVGVLATEASISKVWTSPWMSSVIEPTMPTDGWLVMRKPS